MTKIQPAVTRLHFQLPDKNKEDNGIFYLDISQCVSIVNRRFYRQGLNWAVAGITFVNQNGGSGTISVEKLFSTWCTSNAWEKSFRVWKKMQDDATADVPSLRAKFLDYKIGFNAYHSETLSFDENLVPIEWSAYPTGEWSASRIHIPTTATSGSPTPGANDAYTLHMHGQDGFGSKALIEGYKDSRAVPFSPDPTPNADAAQNWLTAVFNEGNTQDQAVINDQERYDEVPYDLNEYPGGRRQTNGERVDLVDFTGTTVSARNRVKPFSAPCGLLRLNNNTGETVTMYLDLVPGNHRGYLAEPMTDM
jgi:hypothetical protein